MTQAARVCVCVCVFVDGRLPGGGGGGVGGQEEAPPHSFKFPRGCQWETTGSVCGRRVGFYCRVAESSISQGGH